MAPLSGLDNDRLASLWHKVGAYVYTFGSEFYGFVGLRAYKEKFAPLGAALSAVPSSMHLPKVLLLGGINIRRAQNQQRINAAWPGGGATALCLSGTSTKRNMHSNTPTTQPTIKNTQYSLFPPS